MKYENTQCPFCLREGGIHEPGCHMRSKSRETPAPPMPEERKPAPLPPLPWTANEFGPCTQNHVVVRDADGKQVALIPKSQLIAIELAELVCRAPALEAERDDANMQATANNEVATSLHEQLKNARALLRELAAAVRAPDGEIPYTTGWKRARETMLILLRRAEAEAGEEKDDLCPE